MKQTVADYLTQKKYESSLTGIDWDRIAAKSGLKDLELDLLRFKQDKFDLPDEDRKELKTFTKWARQQLKAIETYLD